MGSERWAAWPRFFPKGDSTPGPGGAWARLCAGPGVLQVGSHSLPPPLVGLPAARASLCGEPRPSPVVWLRVQHLRDGGRQRALEARGAVLAAAARRPGRCGGPALPCPRRPRDPPAPPQLLPPADPRPAAPVRA